MMIGLGELDESDKGVRPIRRTDWSLVQRDERVARADARCMRCGTGRDGRTGGRQATEVQEAARARVPRGRRTVGLGLVGRALRCKQSVSRGMMWQCERVSWRMRCWINKYMERTTYTASSWGAAERLHRETQGERCGTRREIQYMKTTRSNRRTLGPTQLRSNALQAGPLRWAMMWTEVPRLGISLAFLCSKHPSCKQVAEWKSSSCSFVDLGCCRWGQMP
ncbi:hypothetical protein HDK77DRAFT_452401 [Phyllosticta capitalensis]